jgi:hypothetical protein
MTFGKRDDDRGGEKERCIGVGTGSTFRAKRLMIKGERRKKKKHCLEQIDLQEKKDLINSEEEKRRRSIAFGFEAGLYFQYVYEIVSPKIFFLLCIVSRRRTRRATQASKVVGVDLEMSNFIGMLPRARVETTMNSFLCFYCLFSGCTPLLNNRQVVGFTFCFKYEAKDCSVKLRMTNGRFLL